MSEVTMYGLGVDADPAPEGLGVGGWMLGFRV